MAIGRISGQMLFNDLERQGQNLTFDGNLLHLDVNNRRVGVNNIAPAYTFDVSGNLRAANIVIAGNTISSQNGKVDFGDIGTLHVTGGYANNILVTDGHGNLSFSNISVLSNAVGFSADSITLGVNTAGQLSSNATSLNSNTVVTDGIALLNQVLGKLVPPAPGTFPNAQGISINSVSTYRMCSFTQTDNTTSARNVAGGSTVTLVRRANTYSTNTIADSGPGDSGKLTVYKNSVNAGNVSMTLGSNDGIYGDLIVTDNVDYGIKSAKSTGFWESFDAALSGTVSAGWNEVYINHNQAGSTNTAYWYYDSSAPGAVTFSNTAISLTSNSSIYSSTIPHFTSATTFTLSANVSKLSGDMYPTSDTFITGTAGGAFATPASLTYSSAGITTPLTRNLYVSSGSRYITTTSSIITGFGSNSTGPSLTGQNSYSPGSAVFAPGVSILYKTGTSTQIEETSIPITSVGTGSGNGTRIINPGSTDTPSFTASAPVFNSQTSTLQAYDATVVAAVLKHDQTNYSTGYLPVGPNLSSGRTGPQYFTFKFTRSAVSKFDITYTGTIAGLWVALPGSTIETTSSLNGWLDASSAYTGSGIPGANTPGNGSNGCAVGGSAVLNSAQTNKSVTVTFGTVSSSSTATNEIYVRVKLTSGQAVTVLSLTTASN